jgi:hypothetical protein
LSLLRSPVLRSAVDIVRFIAAPVECRRGLGLHHNQ